MENSELQAAGIEERLISTSITPEEANYVTPKEKQQQCRKCGLMWPHITSPCPARGRTCRKCGKTNHYARVCRNNNPMFDNSSQKQERNQKSRTQSQKSHIHKVSPQETPSESSDSKQEHLYTCRESSTSKVPATKVRINNVEIKMIIDTGASINIDENTFAFISKTKPIPLRRTQTKLFAYGSTQQLSVKGKFETYRRNKKRITVSYIYVVKGNYGSLLSYQTAIDLGLIKVKFNQVDEKLSADEIPKKFPALFNGIGRLKNFEVKLHINEAVPPVAQPARRIPFHLRKKVSAALKRLENKRIIEKVDGPTPWISPLVIIPKNDRRVRLCVDMRMPNRAIQRERHPSPTIDDLIHEMNGAKVFSKLDLRSGYHQLSLAKESRYITTFVTHKGLRRYTRLNFGTNSASELFQNVIYNQVHDIPGVINMPFIPCVNVLLKSVLP